MTTNSLEVLPAHPSQMPDVVIEQVIPGGVMTAQGRDGDDPPSPPPRVTDAVEILPEADPNAIRRASVLLEADSRLEVATNAPGSLIILVDGRPVDLVGDADRRSVSGVWVGSTVGIASRGSVETDVLSAVASSSGTGRTATVTVIPQHFGARGWRVTLG